MHARFARRGPFRCAIVFSSSLARRLSKAAHRWLAFAAMALGPGLASSQATMEAIRIHEYGGPDVLQVDRIDRPSVEEGELLIRVHAAAVNVMDTNLRSGGARQSQFWKLPYVPGFDVSGHIVEVGPRVSGFTVGDEVFAMIGLTRGGGYAEFAVIRADEAALKPISASHVQAAAVPHVGLTAWQALFDTAELASGQTILIHGGAGGVGSLAVQLASWRGAHVIATASPRNHSFLREIGADVVVDYNTERFEDFARDVDVVLDTIGGETQIRSLDVLREGGILVSLVGLTPQAQSPERSLRATAILVHADAEDLSQLAGLIDEGHLRPIVSHVLPLERAPEAHVQMETRSTRGKIVLEIH